MKVVKLPCIYYECVVEKTNGISTSKFFTLQQPLRSREKCLSYFMELWLSDETADAGDVFLTVYMRHTATGERIELLSCTTYEYGPNSLYPLERELALYQQENIQVETAIWNHRTAPLVLIVSAGLLPAKAKDRDSYYFLADNYWLFLGAKQEGFLSAS
jgi:hypothetical protein